MEQRQLLAVLSATDSMLAGPDEAPVAEASYPQPIPPLLPGELASESVGPYTDWIPQLTADEIPGDDKDDGGKDIEAYTTLIDTGPSSNRIDIVFLGDGYTASQIDTVYVDHIESMLAHMFDENEAPFPRYKNFFNVHSVNVISNESGADVPPDGIFRDTALDAKYYFDGTTERLLFVNTPKANAALNSGLAGAGFTADMKLITVNDTLYGGGGGAYAVWAGGNGSAREVGLHELGHSFSNLADEYHYGDGAQFTGFEPGEANVTTDPTGAKWSHWLGYSDPDFPGMGTIDVYEGAKYHEFGIYRPSQTSKMKSLKQPFNAVSREAIIQDIYQLVDPLDAWHDNGVTVREQDPMLWVDVIDPAVIDVQWSVDGELVPGAVGETFALADFGYLPGEYAVSARAFDPTSWVRTESNLLEQSIQWDIELTLPPIETEVTARQVFYNNSTWDGNAAIATDKSPLLAGERATWANYTNYSRGINGVMIDVLGLTEPGAINEYDFTLRVGNDNDPGNWADAPQPRSITVDSIAGQADMSRISLIWDDRAIANEWLEVTLLATPFTGLSANDVFYFGNAIGDAGDSADHALVNATDEIHVRMNQLAPGDLADVQNWYDFNRDRSVNADDQLIARENQTSPLSALSLITVGEAIAPTPPFESTSESTSFVAPPPAASGDLWITEINYNPYNPTATELGVDSDFVDADFQFIEVYNSSDETLDLEDVEIKSDGMDFTFKQGDSLDAGKYGVIVSDRSAFAARYGDTPLVLGKFSGMLDDNDDLVLDDASGTEIMKIKFKDEAPWPLRPDGGGSSLESIGTTTTGAIATTYVKSENWRASSELGGSPGRQGAEPLSIGVVINEVLTHTDDPFVDAIELYNTGTSEVAIGGWWLIDQIASFDTDVLFVIPAADVIPADGYQVYYEAHWVGGNMLINEGNEFGTLPLPDPIPDPEPDPTGFGLSSAKGDRVALLKPGTMPDDPPRFVDYAEFPAAPNGESFGRWPNVDDPLYPMAQVTLGAANNQSNSAVLPRIGPLIITEIFYNPLDPGPGIGAKDLEFIEIYNPTTEIVYLDAPSTEDAPDAVFSASRWEIDGEVDFAFAARTTGSDDGDKIGPGETLLVLNIDPQVDTAKLRQFLTENNFVGTFEKLQAMAVGPYGSSLGNNGVIQLRDRDNQPVDWAGPPTYFYPLLLEDEVRYSNNSGGWPNTDDSGGDPLHVSLHRTSLNAWGNSANSWEVGAPTPGIANIGHAPQGVDDEVTVDEGDSFTDNVLTNDVDLDGDQLRIQTIPANGNGPQYGSVELQADGTFTYTHDGSEPDGHAVPFEDRFQYRVLDANDSDTAWVTITITPVNDPPVVPDKTASVVEAHESIPEQYSTTTFVTWSKIEGDPPTSTQMKEYNLLWNVTDPDDPGVPLTVTLGTPPEHGTATITDEGGGFVSFRYENNGDEYKDDEFTYWVEDPHGAATEGRVHITVFATHEHPPELLQEGSATVDVGGMVDRLDGGADDLMSLVTDQDFDNGLRYLYTMDRTESTDHGSVTLSPFWDFTNPATLSFEYTHTDESDPADYAVPYQDSFTYRVIDAGNLTLDVTIPIHINEPGQDQPVIDEIGVGNEVSIVEENETNVWPLTATNADSSIYTGPFQIVGGDDALQFTIEGTSQLKFDNPPDFENPTDQGGDNEYHVQVRADDSLNPSDPVTVTIYVLPTYDEFPVFTSPLGDVVRVNENETRVSLLDANDGDDGQPEQELTYSIDGTGPDDGLFSINPSTNWLEFKAPPDYENPADQGHDHQYNVRVQVTETDTGEKTQRDLTVWVDPVDEFPVAENFIETVEYGGTVQIDIEPYVSDEEVEKWELMVLPDPVNGLVHGTATLNPGTMIFTYTHFGTSMEAETLIYEVRDPAGHPATGTVTITVLPVESPPVIGPIGTDYEVSIDENVEDVWPVTATYPNSSSGTIRISGGLDRLQFTIDSAGQLSFVSTPDFEDPLDDSKDNTYHVQVQATDDTTGLSDTEDLIIHVLPVGDNDTVFTITLRDGRPAAGMGLGEYEIDENWADVLHVTATDADLWGTDPEPSVIFELAGIDAGEFDVDVLGEDGVLSFLQLPDYEQPGAVGGNMYEVTIKAGDSGSQLDSYPLTIHVLPVNDNQAVALDDLIVGFEGEEMTFLSNWTGSGPSSVLDNDYDLDDPPEDLRVEWAEEYGPDFGELTLNEDGTFVYIHNGDEDSNIDSFQYYLYEGDSTEWSDIGTVNIQITSTNDTPVAEDFSKTVVQGAQVEIDVWDHASDEEDDDANLTVTFDAPLFGTVSWDQDQGAFIYTHNGIGDETDSFTYTVTDRGLASATGTVEINVSTTTGTAPEFTSPPVDNHEVDVNENVQDVLQVVAFDPNGDPGDVLNFSIVQTDDWERFEIVRIDDTSTQLRFKTPPDYENATGQNDYQVQIQATDVDQQSTTRTLIVHVQPVNEHAPVIEVTAFAGVDYQDRVITIVENAPIDLLWLDWIDDDRPDQDISFSIVSGEDEGDFDIDLEERVLHFRASPNYEVPVDEQGDNTYHLTLQATDGELWSDQLPLMVHVLPFDETPTVIMPDTVQVDEGGATEQLSGAEFSYSVLDNDTENDDDLGEDYFVQLHPGSDVQYGTLLLNLDGTFYYEHGGEEPADHQTPYTDRFEYDLFFHDEVRGTTELWDTTTVTIDVTPVNDPPVALDGNATVTEGGTVDIEMSALYWDIDSDDDPTVFIGPAHGTLTWNSAQQTFTYEHDDSGLADDSFTYEVTDGEYTVWADITISVEPFVQDPVEAVDDQAVVEEGLFVDIDVLGNDTAPSGTSMPEVVLDPMHGTLVPDGEGGFRYTHDDSETPGTDSFTYTIIGPGGSSDTAVVTITVDPWINDNAPTAEDQSITVDLGDTVTGSVQFDDADMPNDVLTVNTAPISGPSHGSLILNADGTFEYTHDGLGTESDAFTYEVRDELGAMGVPSRTVTATVTITVEGDQPSGAVDYRRVDDLDSTGENWFYFTAFRDGIFTALLQADDFGPSTRIELHTGTQDNLQLLESGSDRVDYDQVTAGQPLAVMVTGLESDTDDLLLANLVQVSPNGSEITVFGTAGDDTFTADLGSAVGLTINQVDYAIGSASSISFSGQGGSDLADVTGSAGNEVGMLYPRSATLMGTGYQLGLSDVGTIRLHGGGGDDSAWLFDSAGPDTLTATPDYAELSNGNYSIRVDSFGSVHAFAGGGHDVAELYGSDGADTFRAEPREASLEGNGFYYRAKRFENVIAYAGGGLDIASMYDSTGDDTLEAWPDEASLQGQRFLNQAMDFSHVVVHGGAGGQDEALLHDSAGNDHFVATPDFGAIYGNGFYNRVSKFAQVVATATTGTDVASLFDSPGDDHFLGTPDESTLSGTGFSNRAEGFDSVHAYATVDGHDTATLIGSAGNDTFVSTDTYGSLSGESFHNRAKYFEEVYAEAAGGDMDEAILGDSPGDDLLQADGNWARLSNAALDFLYQVSDFDRVEANAGNSGDTKSVSDPSSLDFLLEMNDLWG